MSLLRVWWSARLAHRLGGLWLGLLLALAVGMGTRLALAWQAHKHLALDGGLLAAFAWGALFDLAAALVWTAPLALVLAALPAKVFARPLGRGGAHALILGMIFGLLFSAVAEWFFWDEFGVRANFIAVDYLVYTTEVIGNIRESYPMPAIFLSLALASVAIHALLCKTGWIERWLTHADTPAGARWRTASVWAALAGGALLAIDQGHLPAFANAYELELAKNGQWSLFAAFRANELDYERFYLTMPIDAAFARARTLLARDGSTPLGANERDLLRLVPAPHPADPELRCNVIQITVESLSADFLTRYGQKRGLTPRLDALIPRSLVFDQFYATGNRTDRGMEALTLSVPPTPGRSLVKRPHNENLFTLGSVLRTRGYATAFIYGGYGYFDNMNHFFSDNGYRVVDRAAVAKTDVTFANAWGACDEDLLRWTLREADQDHAAGNPFFHFVMTTSNHRPFTYPDGRIDLPSKVAKRAGGVKYTDYAIGKFLDEAASHPWFKNTLFVIVADHCASSAGQTELPVENYHIPLIIFAPGGQVAPGAVATVTSQVDYAPTLLGLLNWSYPSRFFGWDVLAPAAADRPGRAFIGNYQKLGLLSGDQLAVLKPLRQQEIFTHDAAAQALQPWAKDGPLLADAIAYYQSAGWLFAHGGQRAP
jgi:phosphoglycerol transferase MdoB-like AlkP superfamily enzyme